jgi:cholesterol oxidase
MASFDYDVVIIGSGFGGSVAALRAAEKGYGRNATGRSTQ